MHWVQQMTLHGLLDDQFDQLLQLQQEDSPGFLQEIITLFFTDSSSKFAKLDQLLAQQPVSFQEVDQTVHQLKGSSASLGARQVADLCIQVRYGFADCACLTLHLRRLHLSCQSALLPSKAVANSQLELCSCG